MKMMSTTMSLTKSITLKMIKMTKVDKDVEATI